MVRRKKIFRIQILDKRGRVVGFKLVEGTSKESIKKAKKSKFVGTGRFVGKVTATRLRTSLAKRRKLPRSRRFGTGFF